MTLDTVPVLLFNAYGKPATQGSKVRTKFGMRDDNPNLKPWRDNVRAAAREKLAFYGVERIEGPVTVRLRFSFDRPLSAPKRTRTWPITRGSGDLDKLIRAVFDAITDSGTWRDDSQVVDLRARKGWCGDEDELPTPGVQVEIRAGSA